MGSVKCTECGRPLRDPESIARRIGPVCAGKVRRKEQREEALEPELIPPKPTDLEGITFDPLPAGEPKVYVGVRTAGRMDGGEALVYVERAGKRRPLHHICYHSPTGMEWGYGGSGPADLARSILWDVAGPRIADALYQDFKWAFVAGFPENGWQLDEVTIRPWIAAQLEQKARQLRFDMVGEVH